MNTNIIVLGSDHAGFILKNQLIDYLIKNKIEFIDLGCYTENSVDYPDYAEKLATTLKTNPQYKGILICGSGVGMSIAANRFTHIRAALCSTIEMAKLAREHNDANVLVLGARLTSTEIAIECLKAFINTEFSHDDRHIKRIKKIDLGEWKI